MTNVLEELFYGRIIPYKRRIDCNPRFAEISGILTSVDAKLESFLKGLPESEEGLRLLERLRAARDEMTEIVEIERFTAGFRLGAGILIDVGSNV